jgi:hypothetical protein
VKPYRDRPYAPAKAAISSARRWGWSSGTKVAASGISTIRALPASPARRWAYFSGKKRSPGAQARRIGSCEPRSFCAASSV